ncbi:MAG: glycosyltransferase family 9 protein [Rhodospirillales bacterium]|nr:glycosyltransferase family 9 protein [Rhodospirillales bacterium]
MNVKTMRIVDFYAGIPICAVVSGVLKLAWRLFPKPSASPRRVLFIELSEMGSTVLAEPAMRKVKENAGAEVYFVIFDRNKGSLLLSDFVPEENIITIRDTSLFLIAWDTLRFLFWTRKNRIDSVVDLELFSRYTALLTGMSGAVNRIGFFGFHNEGLYRGDMLTHQVSYNTHIHIAKNFIALVNSLLSDHIETPYSKSLIENDEIVIQKVSPGESLRKDIQNRVKKTHPSYNPERNRIVLVNPNSSLMLPQRRWMAENYAAVIEKVLGRYEDVVVLITGATEEREEAEFLVHAVGNARCINFAGLMRLSELPALYSVSALMITNDSGPSHFAALTEMPVVTLFGPETPRLYAPLGRGAVVYAGLACSPCVSAANHRKTACTDNQCMKAISVDQVFEVACGYL